MSPSPSFDCAFLVAASQEAAYVEIDGLATMNNCGPLEEFLDTVREQKVPTILFDFSRCEGFDSTFMGLLISIPRYGRRRGAEEAASVVLLHLDDDQRELLAAVGVDRVLDVCDHNVGSPDIELKRLEEPRTAVALKEKERSNLRRVVRAHERLAQLDPENEVRFGDFLTLVRRELERA